MKFKDKTCELEECDVVFTPHRYDQKYCCKLHGNIQASRNWRKRKHREPANKEGILGIKDTQPRGTIKTWKKYMIENPSYFSFVEKEELTKISLNKAYKNLFQQGEQK